jgi:L-amino acid N-acyltransferase YncA
VNIVYAREIFVFDDRCRELFDAHAVELRGFKADIWLERYIEIQNENRLVWITARDDNGVLQGYSSHFWHRDMHYNHKVAQDDAWYVVPELRNKGIGKELRRRAIEELAKDGVKYAYGRLKTAHPHDNSMSELGYVPFEQVWVRKL